MKLDDARRIAEALVEDMRPFCVRVEIAGSIRRRAAEVKDVEIVAIPRWDPVAEDNDALSSELRLRPVAVNHLLQWALHSGIRWIKPSTPEIIPWRIQPDGKYWRGLLPQGMKLDLFLCTPATWGVIFLIRTGSAEFTKAFVTHAKRIGRPVAEGRVTYFRKIGDRGEIEYAIETPEETDVFRALNLQWVPPEKRHAGSVITALVASR